MFYSLCESLRSNKYNEGILFLKKHGPTYQPKASVRDDLGMRVNILHIRPLKFETCIVYIFLLARILHVPTCVGISPIKPAPEDYAHPALQVYLVLMHTLKHTQLSLSYSFFFLLFGGWVALLWACSCILGFLTGSQGANRTPLYL